MKKMICFSALFVGFFFFITSAWAYQPFPDTGQTKCYNSNNVITCPQPGQPFYGQDAHYPRIPRSYTKLGYGGVVLADGALHVDDGGPWIMTRDNVTGLIWEVKTNANRYDGYSWSNALNVFISQLNAQNFGGFSDWRLPEVKELSSLVNRGNIKPAIDTSWFPKTALFANYWSSTPNKVSGSKGWNVSFNYGRAVSRHDQGSLLYVRAVRGGNNYPVNVFVDNGNGTVTDKITGLMWQKERAPGQFTWRQALEYTSTLTLAGYSDWRLPNINELQTLIDYSTTGPAIYPIFKRHTENQRYWSSTTYLRNYGFGFPYSWVVDFRGGVVWNPGGHKSLSIPSVRAVRTAQETVLTDLEKANIIFNWLESNFPDILSPTPQPTYESDGIYFRYYPGTNVYIGTIQNNLYFYDHLGVLHNLGSVNNWLPYAQTKTDNVVQSIYFSPNHLAGVPKNTWVVSNEINVVADASISISGDGGEYRVNKGTYTSDQGNVKRGDKVQIRLKSSTQYYTSVRTTLYIGSSSGIFIVTTAPRNKPPVFDF